MRQYIVERGRARRGQKGMFKVTAADEAHDGYLSEYAALLDAVDAAHDAGKSGEPAQVLTRTKDGTETVIWTYGIDPYPYEGGRPSGGEPRLPSAAVRPRVPPVSARDVPSWLNWIGGCGTHRSVVLAQAGTQAST